jgi:cell division protein FtsL
MNHASIQRYRATGRYKQSFPRRLVSSRVVIPALFAAVVIVFACFQIWQRVYMLGLAKEVSQLEKEKSILTDLLRKTNVEIVDKTRLSRVEPIAMEQLGMARTSTENLLTLVVKKPEKKKDGLDNVVASLKKLADNLPVITETKAADSIKIFESNGH